MTRSDAVTSVTGEIFREGWSRVRGSTQGLGEKRNQMVRAAKGHRAAVFKAIKSGGCHTKGQLSNQLAYLTTKSSHIVDSRGVLDGRKQLDAAEIKSVTERFSARWDEGFRPKMGHTTHLLLSFPIGTKGKDVRDIAAGVCERFLANDARNFDYLIAIHEDRAHPHAHVVLNRRSQEGEYFFLGRDHHFNYDDLRVAMVEEAEKVGVRLEATRRIERGDATYAPRVKEIYAAKAEGREPAQRERVGPDLDRALAEIASTSRIYLSLAAEASAENREDISDALFRAGEMLAQGGQLEQNGEIYMAMQESFDDLRGRFAERAERVEQFVRDAPDAMKAKYEKQLDAIYRDVAHMQPVGVRSATLNDAASDTGVYSDANINKDAAATMSEPETRAQIETALRGTGISSSAVIARVEQGASNAWLEQRWMADDLSKIAKTDGLNLERNEDLRIAADKLDQVHVQLGQALERAGVLRDDGVIEADVETDEVYFRDVEQPEQEEFVAKHPELLSSPGQVYRENSDGQPVEIVDQHRADQIDREVQAIMERSDGRLNIEEAVAADFKARYPDMPGHLADGLATTYAASFELNNRDEMLAAKRDVAGDQDAREAASEANRLDAAPEVDDAREAAILRGIREEVARLRSEGYSRAHISENSFDIEDAVIERVDAAEGERTARQDARALADVERGVGAQFDGKADEFTRFEPVVVERGLIDNSHRYQGDAVQLSIAVQQLAKERASGHLEAQADYRATVLIRDTVDRYGPQMKDAVDREYADRLSALEVAGESGSEGDRTLSRIEFDGIKQEPEGLAKVMREYSAPSTESAEMRRVIAHERTDKINTPFAEEGSGDAFRGEIERGLNDVQLEALRNGDSEVLGDVIDDRLDRLYTAKAYLQSDVATANSEATREVVSEIGEEEYDAHRVKHVHGATDKGQTHG